MFIIFILIFSLLGCIDSPSPPGADRPTLVLDYNEAEEETIIHIRGVEIVKFDEITLTINEKEYQWENIFSIEERTNYTELDIELYAERDENVYSFSGEIDVNPDIDEDDDIDPEKDIIFKITLDDEEITYVEKEDLPYTASLELWEEDK